MPPGRALPGVLLCGTFFSQPPAIPEAAFNLNKSALEYKKQGNLQAAAQSEEQAVQIFKRSLGEYHPDTATALDNLAGILVADGKVDQALPLYTQSISIQQKTLGLDHPDLAASYVNLGGALTKVGRNQEGLDYLRRAFDIDTRSLGPDNIRTGEVLLRIADTAAAAGNKPLARSYLTQIDEIVAKNSAQCPPEQTPTGSDCDRVKELRASAAQSRIRIQ